jgi:exopolysaccharide production protein ExoZ
VPRYGAVKSVPVANELTDGKLCHAREGPYRVMNVELGSPKHDADHRGGLRDHRSDNRSAPHAQVKVQSIQILRFVAASMVVMLHATIHGDASWFAVGSGGVDIFFVISGFIIARMLPTKTTGRFVIDRLTRIYPIYWLLLIPAAILAAMAGQTSWQQTLTSLTLWPVFGDLRFPYLVAGWTLSFEMLFYAAAALYLLNRRAGLGLFALYPAAVIAALTLGWPVLRYIGNPIIAEFMFGLLIAHTRSQNRPLGAVALLAGAGLMIVTASRLGVPQYIFDVWQPARSVVWGIPAAMIVWGALQFEDALRGRIVAALSYGGDASYSIYLTHGLTIWPLRALLPWPISVALAIGIGLICFRFYERPLLAFCRKAIQPRPLAADDRQPYPRLG